MKSILRNPKSVLCQAICILLLGSVGFAATPTQNFPAGKKAKVTGTIASRNGDLVLIKVKKEGTSALINISDSTKIQREKSFRLRRADMDVTAMVPGLTITVEGVGNAKGQLDAASIKFNPDEFAVEVAEEQQIEANKAAAAQAQSTANQGVAAAGAAQTSANQAQGTANAAGQVAVAAGVGAVMDADAIAKVNQRVSDLGDYNTVVEAALFFDSGSSVLSADDKKVLDKLAADAMATPNYMIEIAGYASSTGTKALNQKLSDERATVVAQYLRNKANVPMRRILTPAGYGATHPAAANSDPQGRDINRRVDVKVLVNKGLDQGM
ncbi:MAG: OmpA family protein [Candidatus Korobacteraceae bacterium]|jgi:outer membrane protein OmpA-like peptidoglycan-associated protein